MEVVITDLPVYEVAYIRRVGSYFEPQEHWGRLIHWAMENELFPPGQTFIGISLDDPDAVETDLCRHDACVTVPEGFDKDSHPDISFKKLDGGQYAMYSFYDVPEKLRHAYQFMFGQWLPNSDYDGDNDRCNLEFNLNNPAEDPEGKCRVDLFVPVKRRST